MLIEYLLYVERRAKYFAFFAPHGNFTKYCNCHSSKMRKLQFKGVYKTSLRSYKLVSNFFDLP